MPRPPKPDWTRKLSQPVDLGGRTPLRTLADVRDHLMRLPPEREHLRAVQYVAGLLLQVAAGESDFDVTVPMRMARQAFRID